MENQIDQIENQTKFSKIRVEKNQNLKGKTIFKKETCSFIKLGTIKESRFYKSHHVPTLFIKFVQDQSENDQYTTLGGYGNSTKEYYISK